MEKRIEPIELAGYSRMKLVKYIRELEIENERYEKGLRKALKQVVENISWTLSEALREEE